MLKISEARLIVSIIEALEMIKVQASGNQIARNIGTWSRSTTYRKLDQMHAAGLLSCIRSEDKSILWSATISGKKLMSNELNLDWSE